MHGGITVTWTEYETTRIHWSILLLSVFFQQIISFYTISFFLLYRRINHTHFLSIINFIAFTNISTHRQKEQEFRTACLRLLIKMIVKGILEYQPSRACKDLSDPSSFNAIGWSGPKTSPAASWKNKTS